MMDTGKGSGGCKTNSPKKTQKRKWKMLVVLQSNKVWKITIQGKNKKRSVVERTTSATFRSRLLKCKDYEKDKPFEKQEFGTRGVGIHPSMLEKILGKYKERD